MMGNRTGPLGGNRTNQIKAAGSYLLSLGEEVSLTPGFQLSAISGAPANAWGAHQSTAPTMASSCPAAWPATCPGR